MIEVLDVARVARARVTGALVAHILQTLRERSTVGTNLLEIDRWAQSMIVEAGAESCYVDYAPSFGRGPFGHYICTSVNDAVLHGLPHDYALADGDLLSLDLAVLKGGVAADSAISFLIGDARPPESVALITATERALSAGVAAAGPGARIGDISHAIGSVLSASGYSINTDFGGHGIGSTMHQDPHVANSGRPGQGHRLRPGLLLALEPWVMVDTSELRTDSDGWTLRSATGCRTAHSEHTIAITVYGAEILTLPTHPGTRSASRGSSCRTWPSGRSRCACAPAGPGHRCSRSTATPRCTSCGRGSPMRSRTSPRWWRRTCVARATAGAARRAGPRHVRQASPLT